LHFSKGNQRLEKCEMDDKNKINLRENNREIFKRENDRANSTYQRLIKNLEKMES
jgi:hypothetical protein